MRVKLYVPYRKKASESTVSMSKRMGSVELRCVGDNLVVVDTWHQFAEVIYVSRKVCRAESSAISSKANLDVVEALSTPMRVLYIFHRYAVSP